MLDNPFSSLPDISYREMNFLRGEVIGLTPSQLNNFLILYAGKRKTEQDLLLFSIVGLLFVPGLQRFMTKQIWMGFLFLFTWGLCVIGSIVDLINYKKATFNYNEKVGYECYQMAKMGA